MISGKRDQVLVLCRRIVEEQQRRTFLDLLEQLLILLDSLPE